MIYGVVVGGDAAVARFDRLPTRLRTELKVGIGRAVLLVQKRTKQDKLTDQVLHVRTGRLRRSINTRVEEGMSDVTGTIGTNVKYARPHEFGFDGTVNVREHLRRSKLGNAFTVRAHSMHMHIPERSFLRSSLADEREQIRAELEHATQRALQP